MRHTTPQTYYRLSLSAALALLLSACAGSETPDNQLDGPPDTPIAQQPAETMQELEVDQAVLENPDSSLTDPTVSAFSDEDLSPTQMLEDPQSPLAERVFYFAYDSAKVSDDSLIALEAHGNFIAAHGNVNVRLEGHADERGSREYNIALGDRRAQTVRRLLLFQGASDQQIEAISYGEEKPAVADHSESAWAKNRRVELIYEVR